jgi:hypothetical protein
MNHKVPDSLETSRPQDLDATRALVREWLARQGLEQDAMGEVEIRQIHRVSGGDPRRVERLARQRFQDPALIRRRRPGRHVLGWGVFILAAWITWVWIYPPSPRPPQRITVKLPAQKPAKPVSWKDLEAPAQEAPPAKTAVPAPAAASLPGVRGAAWLQDADGSRYVLQLIGARDIHTLQRFVRRAGLPPRKLTLVSSREHGRPWYVLVYGLYDSSGEARADIGRLTPYVRRLKPWPRTVAALRGH